MNEKDQASNFPKPDATLVIRDPATLKVLSDPLRIEILRAFREPGTVKVVAEQVDMLATKLYYHVNQLEKHGLIRVVDTNVVSGIIEKTYQVAAHHLSVDETLFSGDPETADEQLEMLFAIVFDGSKREALRSLHAGLFRPESEEGQAKGILSRASVSLTREQAEQFQNRFEALFAEYEQLAEQNRGKAVPNYNLTMAFYETVPTLGATDETADGRA